MKAKKLSWVQKAKILGESQVVILSPSIKSLGVILDSHLTFDEHVAAVSKTCFFHIRALRHICASLPDDVAKIIACSIISSRLDYYNFLRVGMSETNFSKHQLVQNTFARVVTGTKRYYYMKKEVIHIKLVRAKRHRSPVKLRVFFKLATLVYNIRQSGSPSHLASLFTAYKPVLNLRSSSKLQPEVNRPGLKTSQRAFRHSTVAV